METHEFPGFFGSYRGLVARFKTGSYKHKFKSPRTYDNDDDNYETIVMIRQQLYGPGGPYGNLHVKQIESDLLLTSERFQAKHKRYQDYEKVNDETACGQEPAKKPKLVFSDFEHNLESDVPGAMADLKFVNAQHSISSFSAGSRKQQFKSSCKSENNYEYYKAIGKILQQLYCSGGLYENVSVNQSDSEPRCAKTLQAKYKRCPNDQEDEEETSFGQQSVKKCVLVSSDFEHVPESGLNGALADLKQVNLQPSSSFKKGSRKHQFKSPRKYDNDDNNHETMAMIRQQLYGPGGPYERRMINQTERESHCLINLQAKCKKWPDEKEDEEETIFGPKPAKDLTIYG